MKIRHKAEGTRMFQSRGKHPLKPRLKPEIETVNPSRLSPSGISSKLCQTRVIKVMLLKRNEGWRRARAMTVQGSVTWMVRTQQIRQ